MGFLILNETVNVADCDIDCDAAKIFTFYLNRSKDVRLEFKDIKTFTECYRQKMKILKGNSYITVEILNEETAEVKTKNFRPDMIELVYKYKFAPNWLITAKNINNAFNESDRSFRK